MSMNEQRFESSHSETREDVDLYGELFPLPSDSH